MSVRGDVLGWSVGCGCLGWRCEGRRMAGECGAWGVECGMGSLRVVACGVWSVGLDWEVMGVRLWGVRCGMWIVDVA